MRVDSKSLEEKVDTSQAGKRHGTVVEAGNTTDQPDPGQTQGIDISERFNTQQKSKRQKPNRNGDTQLATNRETDFSRRNSMRNETTSTTVLQAKDSEYDFLIDPSASDNDKALHGGIDELPTLDSTLLNEIEHEQHRLSAISDSRKKLPIYLYREKLMRAIKGSQVLVVVGETGSGKTTQLPQYLIEEGYSFDGQKKVAVTQPRRVAAQSVATRVADEMGVLLGKEVGYCIRFDDKTSSNTKLKYVTDGMLLRECLKDPDLLAYSCIMIDEAHERTLATDIILALLKQILEKREDLKVIISSATINAKKFSTYFDNCAIFNVPGRRYPVDIHYTLQPESNYTHAAITTIFQIHTTQPLPGDILVFLTGQEEIERAKDKIQDIATRLGSRIPQMLITPIYSSLPQEQQSLIFQETPDECRKIVLATNIAETSLTIDGIKFVIDSGFVKENSYVPDTGMTQLLTVPCSKASVDQRAGRAGRVGPGKCFRLFTKWTYENELDMMPRPEIVRANLSQTVLTLLSLGITDLINFPLLDKPSIATLRKSLETLYILGALNSKGMITELGKMMCEFPCEPHFSRVLYSASFHENCKGVLNECLTIVSMLHETSSLFTSREQGKFSSDIDDDHFHYLFIYNMWKESGYSKSWCKDNKLQYKTLCRVKNIRSQLVRVCNKLRLLQENKVAEQKLSSQEIHDRVVKSFISGMPMNVAKLGSAGYRTISKQNGGLTVSIHPSSTILKRRNEDAKAPPRYILYQQLVLTSKEFVRDCLEIRDESWLEEMVPQVFKSALSRS